MQCNGSYARANRDLDNVTILRSAGRYAVGTCPVCGKRAPIMRPTKRRPALEFGSHRISARAQEAVDKGWTSAVAAAIARGTIAQS